MLRCMQQAYVESCLTSLGSISLLAGWLAVGALVLCLAGAAQDCWTRWKVEVSDGGELRRLASWLAIVTCALVLSTIVPLVFAFRAHACAVCLPAV